MTDAQVKAWQDLVLTSSPDTPLVLAESYFAEATMALACLCYVGTLMLAWASIDIAILQKPIIFVN